MASIAIVALEGLLFGCVDLFIRHPDLKRIFNVQYLHRRITSDIPGNPHCFDYVLISLYNTLPEPSNFNMVWTNVYYNEPLILRGRIPKARINSLTCYTRPGGANYPCSVDLADVVDENGRFEVFIAHAGDESVKCPAGMHRLTSADWERGFICMRNYAVAPGTVYETPELVRASDDKLLRKSEVLIAGSPSMKPQFMEKTKVFLLSRLAEFIVINLLNHFVLKRFFDAGSTFFNSCSASVIAIALTFFTCNVLTKHLYKAGRSRLARQTAFCEKKNKFYLPDDDQAANGSQPCTLHKYWVMQYDIPRGDTLSITGIINPADQKYWSIVLYDEDGVSKPQYVHDVSARRLPVTASSSSAADGLPNDQDAYAFDIRIINDTPPSRPHKLPLTEPNVTTMYVDKCNSKGYVMFRRVHPTADKKGTDCTPRALRVPEARLLGTGSPGRNGKDKKV